MRGTMRKFLPILFSFPGPSSFFPEGWKIPAFLNRLCLGPRLLGCVLDGILHLALFRELHIPWKQRQAGLFLFPDVGLNRAGTPDNLLRQSFPLVLGPQHIEDAFAHPTGICRTDSSSAVFGDQRLHPLIELAEDSYDCIFGMILLLEGELFMACFSRRRVAFIYG